MRTDAFDPHFYLLREFAFSISTKKALYRDDKRLFLKYEDQNYFLNGIG